MRMKRTWVSTWNSPVLFAVTFGADSVHPMWMKNGVTYRTHEWRFGPFVVIIGWRVREPELTKETNK